MIATSTVVREANPSTDRRQHRLNPLLALPSLRRYALPSLRISFAEQLCFDFAINRFLEPLLASSGGHRERAFGVIRAYAFAKFDFHR